LVEELSTSRELQDEVEIKLSLENIFEMKNLVGELSRKGTSKNEEHPSLRYTMR
jgi:hypothetical protein